VSRERAFHDPRAVRALVAWIRTRVRARGGEPITLMEVCGTHTHAIAAAGLRRMLAPGVRLVAGPGCPVCVTPIDYMDRAVALARRPDVTVCTFGDLMRVPSSSSSLERESARGGDVRVVYSARDALRIAREQPGREVVFLAIGFETTLPTVAAALAEADELGLDNLRILPGAKRIEPPLRALVADGDVHVDGFLLPGHVSVVIGARAYGFLERELRVPAVVAGFTPVDVLRGVLALVEQHLAARPRVANLYRRVVRDTGNPVARALLLRYFEPEDTRWRGLGEIPRSGLALRPAYAHRDATRLAVELDPPREPSGCRCGEVLKGAIEPPACPLFDRACTPRDPIGACMVSSEGTCAAWYRHERTLAEVTA
jgi:hydrogenase expression/formation protein HypD